MSGRAKGKAGEREAVRALRAFGLDARRVYRERGADRDVDAVILLGDGRCLAVQVKREEVPRPVEWAREFVGPGAVLMHRANRGAWAVWVRGLLGDAPRRLSVAEFAAWARRGLVP